MTAAVTVSGLRRSYGDRTVIRSLNLRIERGEFVVLLGESGCGKTTLLRALAGLDPIDGGQIEGPLRPAVVFQEHACCRGTHCGATFRSVYTRRIVDRWPGRP
jgi:sulfonate transport system ATP-binding protein